MVEGEYSDQTVEEHVVPDFYLSFFLSFLFSLQPLKILNAWSFITKEGHRILLKKSSKKPKIIFLSCKKCSVKIFHE